jgi:hypothetical protein
MAEYLLGYPYFDIDHTVKTKTIPEIKREIRLANFWLEGTLPENQLSYWLEYRTSYEFALEVAECWEKEPVKPEGKFSPISHYIRYLDKRLSKVESILKTIPRKRKSAYA